MGLMDREYTRRGNHYRPPSRARWQTWLVTAGSVIAVASAALWLLRDIRYMVRDSEPGEGSLVVNINTATQAQLETLPNIGPARAAQIIANRPYESVEDLLRISGIGPSALEDMRALVTTDVETKPR